MVASEYIVMNSVKNKTVVITGSANGLGRVLAIEFYRLGYDMALIDIDGAGLQALQQEIHSQDQRVSTHQLDISIEQDVIDCHADIVCIHPRIEILINNAGISISQPFEMLRMEDFQKLFATNFWGTIYCTKHFLPELKKQGNGKLVNIISNFALMGFPGKTAYASSKGAMMGFTNALKTELAGTSVNVSLVIPPPLDTGLVVNGKHIDNIKKEREAAFMKEKGMPLAKAAKSIVARIERGHFRIVIGRRTYWTDVVSRLFPTAVHKLIGKQKDKIDFI